MGPGWRTGVGRVSADIGRCWVGGAGDWFQQSQIRTSCRVLRLGRRSSSRHCQSGNKQKTRIQTLEGKSVTQMIHLEAEKCGAPQSYRRVFFCHSSFGPLSLYSHHLIIRDSSTGQHGVHQRDRASCTRRVSQLAAPGKSARELMEPVVSMSTSALGPCPSWSLLMSPRVVSRPPTSWSVLAPIIQQYFGRTVSSWPELIRNAAAQLGSPTHVDRGGPGVQGRPRSYRSEHRVPHDAIPAPGRDSRRDQKGRQRWDPGYVCRS